MNQLQFMSGVLGQVQGLPALSFSPDAWIAWRPMTSDPFINMRVQWQTWFSFSNPWIWIRPTSQHEFLAALHELNLSKEHAEILVELDWVQTPFLKNLSIVLPEHVHTDEEYINKDPCPLELAARQLMPKEVHLYHHMQWHISPELDGVLRILTKENLLHYGELMAVMDEPPDILPPVGRKHR